MKVDRPNEEALEEDLLMLTFFLLLKIGSFYYYHLDRQHVGGILKVKLQWCCCVSWLTYVIVFNRQFSWNGRSWDCVCGWLRGRKARPEDPHWQRGQASKGASQRRAQTCLRLCLHRPGSHILFLALMLMLASYVWTSLHCHIMVGTLVKAEFLNAVYFRRGLTCTLMR